MGYKKEDYQNALIRMYQGKFTANDYYLMRTLIEDHEEMKRKIYGLESTVRNQKRQIDKFTKASYKGYVS